MARRRGNSTRTTRCGVFPQRHPPVTEHAPRASANIRQTQVEFFDGQLAAVNNPREREPYHELLGLVALRHNKYQLAQALQATRANDEAQRLYREVAVDNFSTVDFALLRAEARKKAG